MKKLRLIIVTIICLVTTLVVSSFAWFAIGNNGVKSHDIVTGRQVAIYFSESGTNEEAMVPAKLKEGVLNDSGYIKGVGEDPENDIKVPTGRSCLPQIDENDYRYVLTNNNLTPCVDEKTGDCYFEYPATIVYSQFDLILNDNLNQYPVNQKLSIKFDVKFYNVDDPEETEVRDLNPFTQTEALAFNFFVLETQLTNEQLKSISTKLDSDINITTIEDFLITNKNTIVAHKDSMTSDNDPNYSLETVGSYRYATTVPNDSTTYNVTINNMVPNQTYYILIESYYQVPDQLVEGNLPLTGRFVLDLTYNSVNMPQ